MAGTTDIQLAGLTDVQRRRNFITGFTALARRMPLGLVGMLLLLLMIAVAMTAPVLAPYDPLELHSESTFAAPGAQFLMGTDALGRDVFSRVVWGARISLYVGLLSVALGTTSGAVLGLLTAYVGGKFDLIVQRIVDCLQAFPLLVLALVVVAALGASLNNVVIAIAVVSIPGSSRVIRSVALSVKKSST